MKNLLFILIYLIPFFCSAQNFSEEELHAIDSLNEMLNKSDVEDTSKVNAYLDLANYYYLQNADTAIFFCKNLACFAISIDLIGCFILLVACILKLKLLDG